MQVVIPYIYPTNELEVTELTIVTLLPFRSNALKVDLFFHVAYCNFLYDHNLSPHCVHDDPCSSRFKVCSSLYGKRLLASL